MIDTHAHLDDPEFDADREAAIARARAAGVEAIVCVGTTLASSRAAVRLAETHADIYAAVGVHPNSCAEAGHGDWEAIAALAEHPRVVALGETGLDRHWDFAPLELQIEWFRRHLRLGRQTGLPVVVHCRDAAADLLPILQEGTAAGPSRLADARLQRRRGDGRQVPGVGHVSQLCGQRDVRRTRSFSRFAPRRPPFPPTAFSSKPTVPISRPSLFAASNAMSRRWWRTRRRVWPGCAA